jgi:putative PIN family toxin of toxin-antitoxin system
MPHRSSVLKIVFDTNVVISATLFRSGTLSSLRSTWKTGEVVPIVSKETSAELLRVLTYKKFKLSETDIAQVLALYLPHAQSHDIDRVANRMGHIPTCRDARDQIFLELAQSAQANFLVTGDEDLLCLDDPTMTHLNFRIITPAALIEHL